MRVPDVLDGRYQITDEIGRGGMGAVYRALDRKTAQYVAIKVMLDASNQEFLALFDKEWRILAELQHTNIIGISDRGEFQDGFSRYPYFVMPFLRGKTLHQWIGAGNALRPVPEVVAVISAAGAGLQAAHNRGLVHRDIKPSNIFVLDSGSVVVIDFGIVHLGDSRTGTTLKGTTPYIAPELLDPEKNDRPSPQSDVFSLGVVCYEALTGIQPFARTTHTDTIRAILKDIPKPAYEVNRTVSLLLGQVVQKAMAKNKNHRYKTVSEFADQLQRANRDEELPQFGRQVIEDKLRVVREAISQGLVTQAHKMLRDVEDDGFIDPSITAQRERIDQLLQQKWIRAELESARIYRSNEEYATAMEKVAEVLSVVPENAEALAELHVIRQKRLGKALGDARRHIDKHEFSEARKWIEEARQISALDTQTSELLAELTRLEEADHELAEQKETLYKEAQNAYRAGYLPGTLRRLERIAELIRRSAGIRPSHRDSIFLRFYDEVRQEHARLDETWERAKANLAAGDFAGVIKDCNEILVTNPGESRLEALRLQAESRQRELRLGYVQQVSAQLYGLDNLDDRVVLLQEALAAYAGESQLQELLRNTQATRDLMNGLMARARLAEGSEQFAEALEQLRTAESLHPLQPGIRGDISRIERRLDEQARGQRKAEFTQEVWRRLRNAEYERAARVCINALEVFPGDGELLALQADVHERLKRSAEAKTLLESGRGLLHEERVQEALDLLRRAYGIDRNDRQVRQFFGIALVAKAESVLQSDITAAEQLFEEALPLIPNDPALRSLSALIADRRQGETVELALTKARHLALSGDLRGAVREIDEPLRHYPGDRRLLSERAELLRNLGEHIPTPTPVKQPALKTPPAGEIAAAAAAAQGSPRGVSFDSMFAARQEPSTGVAEANAASPEDRAPQREPSLPLKAFAALWTRVLRSELLRTGFPRLIRHSRLIAGAAAVVLLGLSWITFRAVARKPPSPAAPLLITMSLVSNPAAVIAVDGAAMGNSPLMVHLKSGSHTVSASAPGYESQSVPVKVDAHTHELTLRLRPLPLRLHILTDQPKTGVSLDGQIVGNTASDGSLVADVSPGPHSLTFENVSTPAVHFQFAPGQLAEPELPPESASTVFFFASLNGRAHARCNCRPSKMTIGNQQTEWNAGEWKGDLAVGEYPVTIDTLGNRKLTVAITKEPTATVAVVTPLKSSTPEPESIDALVHRADILYDERNYQAADNLVNQALLREPNHERAKFLKARLDRLDATVPFRAR